MKRTAFSNARGFSAIQLTITIAVVMIVTGFAVVSISRARDHVRLMNSARQFAAYVERARGDAVRRHNSTTVSVVDNNTYSVLMDWNGFGNSSTRTFDLEPGIVFTTGIKAISFDWRGRAVNGEDSFGFWNGRNTVNVGVTGSGDVTFESQFFSDSVLPPVALNNGNPGGVMPEPGASPQASPGASPGASPSPSPGASPGASPSVSPSPGASPGASPSVSPSPGASPSASPSPGASPNPSPAVSPVVCSITANPSSMSILSNGSATVNVNLNNFTGSGTISATSDNSGQIQVSPNQRTVSGVAAVSFTVTVKLVDGSVTFYATGCGSNVVPVTIR